MIKKILHFILKQYNIMRDINLLVDCDARYGSYRSQHESKQRIQEIIDKYE